jgi:hypothetical protein
LRNRAQSIAPGGRPQYVYVDAPEDGENLDSIIGLAQTPHERFNTTKASRFFLFDADEDSDPVRPKSYSPGLASSTSDLPSPAEVAVSRRRHRHSSGHRKSSGESNW